MTIQQLTSTLGIGLIAILSLVQITPIKINPWTSIIKCIGKMLNADMMEQISSLEKKLDKHIDSDDKRYAKMCRIRILQFDEEIRLGKNHTEEHFIQIMDDIDWYENYCKESKDCFKNSVANFAIQNIQRVFTEARNDNSFL